MTVSSILYAVEFNNFLKGKDYDAIIIRGDRYEMLGLAMVAVYKGFTVVHIEGGDQSGVVDNKVRHAITHLSDYHFCTNEESHKRLIGMGAPLDRVWNYGSLDVEYASKVPKQKLKERPYLLVAYHPIDGEDEQELETALSTYKQFDIIRIGSNKDYGRSYGAEQFSPETYINMMRGAACCIGNSSSLIKEASILGVGVVLVGDRQKNRLMPSNVLSVPNETERIKNGISYQLGNKAKKDLLYYKPNTSKAIATKLKEIL